MAVPGYVSSQLASLGAAAQGVLTRVFEYVLSNLKFGPPTHKKRASNFQIYCLQATSPATPGEEFSIEHGLASAPYLLFPALDLRQEFGGSVNVTPTRPSDEKRVYLSCTVANAPITVYVEGA